MEITIMDILQSELYCRNEQICSKNKIAKKDKWGKNTYEVLEITLD